MKTLIVACVVGLVLVFGCWWLFGGHIKYWGREVKEGITDMSSDKHLVSMSEDALIQARSELKNHWSNIYKVKIEMAKLEADIRVKKEKLAREEQILRRAQEILESQNPEAEIMIGDIAYTYGQVNDDVIKRVSFCEILRRTIRSNEQSFAKLQKAYQDGYEMIRRKNDELSQKRIEFEAEKAELAALRSQQHIDEAIGKIYSSADIKTELGQARMAFERRLNLLKADAEFEREFVRPESGAVETWNKELGIPTETAIDAVKKYFQLQTEKVTQEK